MKNKFYYGLMAATGLLFAGCSSDEIIPTDKVLEADQAFYVSMRISGDIPTSRAAAENGNPVDTDFNNGTQTESTIDNAYFVFYDENGNTVGDVVDLEIKNSDWEENTENGTVEKYYKSVTKVSVTKGEKAPTQVICYLNPVNKGNLKVNLDEIQTLQLETAVKGSGNNTRFPMSNSVYYQSTTADAPLIAVPLTMNVNVFTTEGAAEEALGKGDCAEIYVERYATKLTFDASKAVQTPFVTGQRAWDADGNEISRNKITLTFKPLYWGLNAESKKTYVIKSFRKEQLGSLAPGQYNYTYADLNVIINDGLNLNSEDVWKWNAPSFFRSYWGMSPAYFTDVYPEVSSDLDNNHSELQKYVSFDELADGSKGFTLGESQTAMTAYFKETTVGSVALASKNPAAAVASVLYAGEYNVTFGETKLEANTGFYTYLSGPVPGATADADNQPYIYFENIANSLESTVKSATGDPVANAETMFKRFLIQCSVLYKKEGQDYVAYTLGDGDGFDAITSLLSVSQMTDEERQYYDDDKNTELKLQHNARTLRFNKVPATGDNIYVLTYNGYKKVVNTVTDDDNEMTLQDANIALAKNVGFALYYTLGHAYFNIPVKHFGWYRTGNEQKNEATIDWSQVRVGDFGMVRNHAYTIEVGAIKGLANGIGGDDVEIVPPSSETNYYVSYKVNILRWAIVPPQKADL